jgi:uncharacterized protein (TIGR00106 family)
MEEKQRGEKQVIAEFSVIPVGSGEDVANYIAEAVKMVDDSGLDYQLTAMGTLVEGDSNEVMKLICWIHDELIKKVPRLEINLRIDDHKGRTNMIAKRIHEIEDLTGREINEAF